MAGLLTREGINFLYRSEEGTVDRRTWWLGTILLAAILFVLTVIWLALKPWAGRGLDERAMIDGLTIAAYVYVMFYAFALFFLAISYVNLTSKRFRTRGFNTLPAGLAGIPLVLLLIAGGLYWVQLRLPDRFLVWGMAIAAFLAVLSMLWQIFELGLRADSDCS